MTKPITEVIRTDGFWSRIRITVKGRSPEALKLLVESLKEKKEDGEVVPFSCNRVLPLAYGLANSMLNMGVMCAMNYAIIGYEVFHGDPENLRVYPWAAWVLDNIERKNLKLRLREKDQKYEEHGNMIHANMLKHGYLTREQWALDYWGCARPEVDVEFNWKSDVELEMVFTNPRTFPEPVIRRIIWLHPNLMFFIYRDKWVRKNVSS